MKRFLWALSGIVSAILLVVASSSTPANAESMVVSNDWMSPSSITFYYMGGAQQGCTDKIGQMFACNMVGQSSASGYISVNGFDFNLPRAIPANSYVTLSFSLKHSDYFNDFSFSGWTTAGSFSIVDQDVILTNTGTQYSWTFTVTVYTSIANSRLSLRALDNGVTLHAKTDNKNLDWQFQSLQILTVVGGSDFLEFMNIVSGAIKDGSFNVAVDNSDVISSLEQGQQQAHEDSQAQLQEQQKQTAEAEKQTQIQEEQKNFVTDTSTPDASDIANSDTIPSLGLLPDGPLDSLLLLPLNIMNSFIQSMGGACSPIDVPVPFTGGDKIVFPCFNESVYKGAFETVANIVGGIGSAFLLYGYFKYLYNKIDRAVSLNSVEKDRWGIM